MAPIAGWTQRETSQALRSVSGYCCNDTQDKGSWQTCLDGNQQYRRVSDILARMQREALHVLGYFQDTQRLKRTLYLPCVSVLNSTTLLHMRGLLSRNDA
jgi:hypothetical protein